MIIGMAYSYNAWAAVPFQKLERDYNVRIKPLIKSYCLKCHSTKKEEGELDMERISTLAEVRKNPKTWLKVREMMGNGEMPPKKKPQLSAKEAQFLSNGSTPTWMRRRDPRPSGMPINL